MQECMTEWTCKTWINTQTLSQPGCPQYLNMKMSHDMYHSYLYRISGDRTLSIEWMDSGARPHSLNPRAVNDYLCDPGQVTSWLSIIFIICKMKIITIPSW